MYIIYMMCSYYLYNADKVLEAVPSEQKTKNSVKFIDFFLFLYFLDSLKSS